MPWKVPVTLTLILLQLAAWLVTMVGVNDGLGCVGVVAGWWSSLKVERRPLLLSKA